MDIYKGWGNLFSKDSTSTTYTNGKAHLNFSHCQVVASTQEVGGRGGVGGKVRGSYEKIHNGAAEVYGLDEQTEVGE